MVYLQSEYGYINDLGMFLVPNSMQKESNFKVFKHNDELVTIIKSKVEDNYLILKHFKTVSYKEYKKMKLNRNDIKDIITMDEFGRITLPKNR